MTLSELFPTIPPDDLEILANYAGGSLDVRWGMGNRPAVLVVDMTRAFVTDESSTAFVETGVDCAKNIATLLQATRSRGWPTIYTRGEPLRTDAEAGAWLRGRNIDFLSSVDDESDHEIVDDVIPRPDDLVISKAKPSAFFGTQLISILTYMKVDTLIVTGVTTSGCVRATVNDAFNHNYRIVVPFECVADRARISHEVELFDMGVKYADVVPLEDLLAMVERRNEPGI